MGWIQNTYGTTSITQTISAPPWSETSITWGPITIHDPQDVVDSFGNPYDTGVNNTDCLVLTFGANLRGATSGGAAIPCGTSCINNDPAWRTLHGRITSIICQRQLTGQSYDGPGHAGIICLASQTNIDEGGGAKGYALIYDNISFSARFRLIQLNNGFSGSLGGSYGSSYTLLAQSGWNLFSVDASFTLALEWEVDQTYLYGTRLHAYITLGSVLSEPYLEEWHILHTGADAWVPTTQVGGGAGHFCVGSTTPIKVYFDNTSIAP